MSLISKLLEAARSWQQRWRGPKTAKRTAVAVEHLDHRQLLSVNFTGNVAIDFPATQRPGVVVFNSTTTPNIQHPIIPPFLQPLIPVSGFDISEIRVSYDATNDTLSVGFNQPPADPTNPSSGSVIAGDADDNGNAGTVNPAVAAIDPGFTEFYALGGGETMAAFLDLTQSGIPQFVAGFSPTAPAPTPTDPAPPKPYQVALAIPNMSNPHGVPSFGTPLPNNTGNVFLFNSASHPNLEFSISHFSQLYQSETGKPLTSSSVIGVGAFAGSPDDIGISDAFFPESTFTLGQATLPPPNPPPSPPILINPHEHRIIDTSHRDLVRVTVFGTSGFDVTQIDPATVELDGAHPIAHVKRKFHRDEFLAETYVFVANQMTLPKGLTTATLTGKTFSGTTFVTQKDVLNIPFSARAVGQLHRYLGGGSIYKALKKIEARNPEIAVVLDSTRVASRVHIPAARGRASVKVDYNPAVHAAAKAPKAAAPRQVVSIRRRDAAAAHVKSNIPARMRIGMRDYLGGMNGTAHPAVKRSTRLSAT
jgi:hypothetical protein